MGGSVKARDYGAIATQYARDVVEGRIVACKWARLACQRHLDDLARAGSEGFAFTFNPELEEVRAEDDDRPAKKYRPGDRVCKFAELMPHIKGDWAARRQRIRLEPWQVFVLASVFGWVHMETGKRRFRAADLIVPRKNAKSTLGAVIGLYLLAVDGEHGAEIYSGATTEYQAKEVFTPARLMATYTPEFRLRYNVDVRASNLSRVDNNSKFEPVIGRPGDGASPSCAIVDEYHEHRTSELYDTMQTGMGARSQPLMLVITTAGADVSGPCYAHQVELQKILEGTLTNERRFGIIYTVDEAEGTPGEPDYVPGDEWDSELALRKANPNFGVSVDAEFLLAQQEEAKNDPRKQNTFKTKHLNVWVSAASPWLNLAKVQRLGDAPPLDSWRGAQVYVGLDLASKVDIASRVLLFRDVVAGKDHYYLYSHNYVPRAAADKEENEHYRSWEKSGHLIVTAGNMIHLGQIETELLGDIEQLEVAEIAMDAWGSREMAPNLQEEGHTVIDIPMTTRHLSEPMKQIEALVEDGRLHHTGDPALIWMLSNVEVVYDRNDNIFPRKARPQNKIDAAVATIIAMSRAMLSTGRGGTLQDWLRAGQANRSTETA